MDRRQFMQFGALAASGALFAHARLVHAQDHSGHGDHRSHADHAAHAGHGTMAQPRPPAPTFARRARPSPCDEGYVPVITPNGSTLPLRRVGAVKVGHLIAEEIEHEFAPGLRAICWGYNGSTPGPTIEAVEGDRIRLYVTNRLPEPTTVHWHGLILPNGMDGVAGLTQRPIPVGETWVYEFDLRYPGTFMYHPHYDEMTQMALGMAGMFIVHPRRRADDRIVRDFVLMTHEWKIEVGTQRPDPAAMNDFNVLTFNSRAFPATEPLVVGTRERVRIRLGNLSPMDHHPIHLHGLTFMMTATDGGEVPPSARYPETTVLVPVGSTRVIEFEAEEPGDWAMHCHMTHHVMLQMGHGIPNMVGVETRELDRRMRPLIDGYMSMGQSGGGGMGEMGMPIPPNSLPMRGGEGPFSYIDMGGMFTVLKVRDDADETDPNAWYEHPAGSVCGPADPATLNVDGVVP